MSSELVIRRAVEDDLGGLVSLLPAAGQGESLLPVTEDECLLVAARASSEERAADILGCVRVRYAIGLRVPRFWYHVGCAVHAAPELELFHQQRTLLLGNDLTGAWEIADLACDAALLGVDMQLNVLRPLLRAGLGEIDRQRSESTSPRGTAGHLVICELSGVRDEAGQSPFWQSLGRHFYGGDPLLASERFGPSWKTHVAALLPREPLLVSFLTEAAQIALGQPNARARLQARVLQEAGLRAGRHVTLEDAGPVFEGDLDLLLGKR